MFKKRHLVTCLIAAQSMSLYADHSHDAMPEVVVEEFPLKSMEHRLDGMDVHHVDTAEALKSLPGAAVNRNGSLSGIAVYRGMFGDRVAVSVDSAAMGASCPNAMDAPLSYVPAALLKDISVDRGVASVSKAQESLGGIIEARSEAGGFSDSDHFDVSHRVHTNYSSQNDGLNSSFLVNLANNAHSLALSSSLDSADDSEFDGGTIDNTEYERRRHDINYGYRNGDSNIAIKLSKNNTDDSGTPALPMDITAVDSDLASIEANTQIGDIKISLNSSYAHVIHSMDNYTMRTAATTRESISNGQNINHKLMASIPIDNGEVRVGIDQSESHHSANIYDPNAPAFLVTNFNDTKKDITGVFAEWSQTSGKLDWELGLRSNQVKMDADAVTVSGVPAMAVNMANTFNAADRNETYNNRDIVLKTTYRLNPQVALTANLASKERAPSYQERFLWMAMQSTGGLADGRTYVGNLDLKSETSKELNLGVDFKTESGYVSLHTFYRKVADYIQGTPDGAPMNADLKYNNIDAKLCGGELSYGLTLTDNLSLDGSLNYVRGKRDDGTSDDLYRIAPLNNKLALNYQRGEWQGSLISEIYDEQNRVSQFNGETESSGYSLWHIKVSYNVNKQLQLRAGIDNLTDKRYQDHLGGVNRVANNDDIAVGERLYGTGRSLNLGATYSF